MTKKMAERRHARTRARERYGLEVGDHTRDQIVAAIQHHRSTPVFRTSLRVVIHDVALDDGTVVRVAYDKHRKELVTFLPRPDPVDG